MIILILTPTGAVLVLWLHILAATIWIGGQIMLGGLVPILRGHRDLVAAAARRFALIAWPAFVILLITGVANMSNAGIDGSNLTSTEVGRTLTLKLVFVALSGLAAASHSYIVGPRAARSGSTYLRALNGILAAVSLLGALFAALYGVVIAEH